MRLRAYSMHCHCTARVFVGEVMPLFLLQNKILLQDNQYMIHKPGFFIQFNESLDYCTAVHTVFSLNLIFKSPCELKLEDVGSLRNRIAFRLRSDEYLRNSKYPRCSKYTSIFYNLPSNLKLTVTPTYLNTVCIK